MIPHHPALKRQKTKTPKYPPTVFIDAMLRKLYEMRLAKGQKQVSGLRTLATKIGWPKHALMQRARQLGLAHTKEPPWSEAEIEVVQRNAHYTDAVIQRKLKQAGFPRTLTAVHLKVKRLKVRAYTDYLSAVRVAELFGCDNHCITKWIRLGYLKAKKKGTARTKQQGGDAYLIHPDAIHDFIVNHPTEFDIRKVTDQLWFLDCATKGLIKS